MLSLIIIALMSGCTSHSKITPEIIHQDLAGKTIGAFACQRDTIEDLTIIKSTYDGNKATITIDMKTDQNMFPPMSGRLRLHYEWIVHEWKLTMIENLSFK